MQRLQLLPSLSYYEQINRGEIKLSPTLIRVKISYFQKSLACIDYFWLFCKIEKKYWTSFSPGFLHPFSIKCSLLNTLSNDKVSHFGRVAQWIKTLKLESEFSRFKSPQEVSWGFLNFFLAVPQPNWGHYQKDSLANQVLITAFFTILTVKKK